MTTEYRRIPWRQVSGSHPYSLGRHVHHDDRSAAHPAELAPVIRSVTHRSYGLPLDQGSVGSCTAEALTGCLNTLPDYTDNAAPRVQSQAYALYAAEVAAEGGTFPPDDPGGSGLLVCQVARAQGLIGSYNHVFDAESALKALTLRPGMFGVNWYDSFDSPDDDGVITISPNASVRGGHEVFAYGLDVSNELIWFWNSWGNTFGVGGRFAMSFATAERLLSEDGDMIFPVK